MIHGPLGVRVRFKHDESLLSLQLRLAHRHGLNHGDFAASVGLPRLHMQLPRHLERLSELSGVPIERLSLSAAGRSAGKGFALGGHELGSLPERIGFRRLCPDCIKGDINGRHPHERAEDAGYLRVQWTFGCFFGCLRHGRELVHICAACGDRPSALAVPVTACHCGASLITSRPRDLTAGEITTLEAISRHVDGQRHVMPPMLAHLALNSSLATLRFLGEASLAADDRACLAAVSDTALLTAGTAVLSDLPRSFESLLSRLDRSPGRRVGPSAVYGATFKNWLWNAQGATVLVPMLLDHFAGREDGWIIAFDGPPRSTGTRYSSCKNDVLLSIAERRRFLGSLGLEYGEGRELSVGTAITLGKKTGQLLGWGPLMRRLGISGYVIETLLADGFLKVAWTATPDSRRYFYVGEVDIWMQQLIGMARRARPNDAKGLLTLRQYARAAGQDMIEVLRSVSAGKVRVAAVSSVPSNLCSLRFRPPKRRQITVRKRRARL